MMQIYQHPLADVYYEVIGTGFPVVNLHGFELSSECMMHCLEPICRTIENTQRIYFDLPGMGESVAKPGLSNAQQMLEIIVEVIEHIIPNQEYGLIGHSYGSYLGLRLMQEHKDKITNALFICPVIKAYPENRKLPPFRIVYKDEEFISTLSAEEYNSIKDWMVIQTKETYTRYLNEFLPAFLSGQKDWQEDFFVGGYGFTDEDEVYQKICEVPTSFLCGKEDNVVGYQDAVDLSAKFNKGDVIILSEAGHNLPIEQTEKFNNILKHWITSVRKKIRAQI